MKKYIYIIVRSPQNMVLQCKTPKKNDNFTAITNDSSSVYFNLMAYHFIF